jgi:hypothetical protein
MFTCISREEFTYLTWEKRAKVGQRWDGVCLHLSSLKINSALLSLGGSVHNTHQPGGRIPGSTIHEEKGAHRIGEREKSDCGEIPKRP